MRYRADGSPASSRTPATRLGRAGGARAAGAAGATMSTTTAAWTPEVARVVRNLVVRELARHRKQLSLQVTELVHEVYMRLPGFEGSAERPEVLALIGGVVRGAAVDLVRRRLAAKRGRGWLRLELDPDLKAPDPHPDLLLLDRALERLESIDPLAMKVVEARYFAGLSIDEAAQALAVGRTTVTRRWRWAKAWLLCELGASP
jgi:RNA polymerase sigma factor (TIGR02999 family)